MDMPKNPRATPTQIKTVPSGRFDLCMNGALLVSGIIRGGAPTPARVGAFESPGRVDEEMRVENSDVVGVAINELVARILLVVVVLEEAAEVLLDA